MKRKSLLWLLLTTLAITAAITVQTPSTKAQEILSYSLDPLIIDTRNMKNVGDTFSINVTMANMKKIWGYSYMLRYNDSVINATNYAKIETQFTEDLPSEIGPYYVAIARSRVNGDTVGVTSVDPLPIDRIDFVVTGLGTTALTFDPTYSDAANVMGQGFKVSAGNLVVNNGKFSNIQALDIHDVAVTSVSASTTKAVPGDSITIDAVVANHGGFTENITVTAQYNATLTTKKQIGSTQTITNLAVNDEKTLTFTWDTATDLKSAVYEIIITANIAQEEKVSDNVRMTTVEVASPSTGIPMMWIYIGIGVAVIVIAIVVVLVLRARRK